jgi:MoxR-like ATPase
LLQALTSEKPVVLLIDEIDRADAEFEAFLLEILSDFQVSVPELGTIKARHHPMVVLTSNNTRELSEALKRRALYLYVDYPTLESELQIVRLRAPDLSASVARQVVEVVHRLRELELKKRPA